MLNLTREEALEILWENDENFEIISDKLCDKARWSLNYELIVKRKIDGKFFQSFYSTGSTESQEESPWEYYPPESPWEYYPPEFKEVFPIEKKVIVYE